MRFHQLWKEDVLPGQPPFREALLEVISQEGIDRLPIRLNPIGPPVGARQAAVFITRSASDERAERVKVTAAGLKLLRRAMPLVIDLQRRLFGAEGEPGGELSRTLLRVDGAQVD